LWGPNRGPRIEAGLRRFRYRVQALNKCGNKGPHKQKCQVLKEAGENGGENLSEQNYSKFFEFRDEGGKEARNNRKRSKENLRSRGKRGEAETPS